tara:strand:+ start:86 stop:340 length:255 start_codon:yes stop_codon:yes gene_type:complete
MIYVMMMTLPVCTYYNALKTSFVVSKNKRAAQKKHPRALLLLSKESFGDDDDVNDACTLLLCGERRKASKRCSKKGRRLFGSIV